MEQKKVSICINTYNLEKYIAQAIESVLMQKVNFDYEIVIGDDASTDSTIAILENYRKKYPEILRVFYQEENKGRFVNLYRTLIQCTGEYIAFLDGDDFWTDENKLQRQVHFLDTNNKYAGIIHNSITVNEKNEEINAVKYPNLAGTELNQNYIFHLEGYYPASSLVFRKKCIENYPAWFIDFADIWQLNLILTRKKPLAYWNEYLVAYRVHSNSLFTSTSYIKQQEYKIVLCEGLLKNHIFEGKYDKLLKNRIGVLAFQIAPNYKNENKDKYLYYKNLYRKYGLKLHGVRFFHNYIFHLCYPELWKQIKAIVKK